MSAIKSLATVHNPLITLQPFTGLGCLYLCTNTLKPIHMLSVLICSLLAAYPTFSWSAEISHSVSGVAICADPTITWDAWKDDESRMTWWLQHGWQIVDGTKLGTAPLNSTDKALLEAQGFNPLNLSIQPSAEYHRYWSIEGERTFHLISLNRCEVLYQRYLVNQAASKIDQSI